MKKLLFLLLLLGQQLTAQTFCEFIDSGELLSTYTWNAEDEQALAKLFGKAKADEIVNYSNEGKWPSSISSLDGRNTNRSKINDYHARFVYAGNGFTVVLLAVADNGHMPSGMRPTKDFYFIIGNKGIKCNDTNPPNFNNKPTVKKEEPVEETPADGEFIYAKITNPMELMSTPDISKFKSQFIEDAKLEEGQYEYLVEVSNEKSWPSAISTFSAREKNRARMVDYKLIFVTYYGEKNENVLVYCPAAMNKHMGDLAPERDLAFAFQAKGVKVLDAQKSEPAPAPSPVSIDNSSFAAQLNTACKDFPNNFSTIKGVVIKREENSLDFSENYVSKVQLKGAKSTIISKQLLGGKWSFHASFDDFRDKNLALSKYKALCEQVAQSKFECCTFASSENIDETLTSTAWLPFDLNGKMNGRLKEVYIEVRLIKFLGIDEKFKTYDKWSLNLYVWEIPK